ncbi:hypothetical protein AURDEDRAFT_153766 [Auricularia subglabra TFB-10046 SS5]|uniref:Uncharacterized protein n=1 Tax=Auricularia subglabra (strain TFB-10046 / SS5) TaxID=717982 RepID=J0LIS5_AURST|nr:hypothetical protein AURDEDRAFT_153766 [Auricularia subglabra TFB-10046 SS5]
MGSGGGDKTHILPTAVSERSEHTARSRLLRYVAAALAATALAAFVLWPRSSGPHCRLPLAPASQPAVIDHPAPIQSIAGEYKHAAEGEPHELHGIGDELALHNTQHADDENGEPVWCYFNSTLPMPVGSYLQQFSLPLSLPELFIVDKSFKIHDGQANYEVADTGTNDMRVRLAFDTDIEGCSVNVCFMEKPNGGAGLVLSDYEDRSRTSECWRANTVLGAQITFPRSKQDSLPTLVTNFRAELGYAGQELRGLGEDVFFDELLLKGSQRPIILDSLQAHNLSLETRAGDITLRATVSGNAILESESGSISASVALVARTDADGYHAPALQVGNFFGPLTTDVALTGDVGPDDVIHYTIRAGTVVGPNVLNVTAIPPRANIDLLTQTAFSSTVVTLHPAFEGNITLYSKDGTLPILSVQPHPEDPERRGRNRTVATKVEEDDNGLTITGHAFWGPQAERPLHGKILCMSGEEASLLVQL